MYVRVRWVWSNKWSVIRVEKASHEDSFCGLGGESSLVGYRSKILEGGNSLDRSVTGDVIP